MTVAKWRTREHPKPSKKQLINIWGKGRTRIKWLEQSAWCYNICCRWDHQLISQNQDWFAENSEDIKHLINKSSWEAIISILNKNANMPKVPQRDPEHLVASKGHWILGLCKETCIISMQGITRFLVHQVIYRYLEKFWWPNPHHRRDHPSLKNISIFWMTTLKP